MRNKIVKLKSYGLYIVPVLSLIALVVLLNQTNPLEVGPAGILLVFGLAYMFIASILYLLLTLVMIVLAYFVSINMSSRKKLYRLASIISFAPVFLLALNSIGQLEIKDFILVVALVAIASFYTIRRN